MKTNEMLGYIDSCGNFYINLHPCYTENIENILDLNFFQKMSYYKKRNQFVKNQQLVLRMIK